MTIICQPRFSETPEAGLCGESSSNAGWYLPCKTAADRIAAVTLLVLTGPIILLLIAMIRATSKGPALYKQCRLGRGGRPFHIFKLRTMTHDCERLTGAQWAKAGDPRVTPLGRFLRGSHLDELPQLWNVVRGEMSLVGPRPERPEFVAKLELAVPDYRERLRVRPGITGLSQIQLPADRDLDDVCRKVQCDICYILQMSPLLDFKIMLGTIMKIMNISFERTRGLLHLPGMPDTNAEFDSNGGESSPIGVL